MKTTIDLTHVPVNPINLATVSKDSVMLGTNEENAKAKSGDFLYDVVRYLIDYADISGIDTSWMIPVVIMAKDAYMDDNTHVLHLTTDDGKKYYIDFDALFLKPDNDDVDDIVCDEPESLGVQLYDRTWQNTGMKDQPVYYFQTEEKDGVLGDAVGTIRVEIPNLKDVMFYIGWTFDTLEQKRCDVLEVRSLKSDYHEYYKLYDIEEDGLRGLADAVIDAICEVQNYGRAAVYCDSDSIISALNDISNNLDLGYKFHHGYCYEEMSDFTIVYSREVAEKLYLGKCVQFVYKKELIQPILDEFPNATCDFELHETACEYDGYIEYDNTYVIIFENEEERQMNA